MSHAILKRIATDIMAKLQTRSAGVGSGVVDIPQEIDLAPAGGAIPEDAISKKAYQLWLERGCPEGSPEQDWYQAESQLKGRSEPSGARPSKR